MPTNKIFYPSSEQTAVPNSVMVNNTVSIPSRSPSSTVMVRVQRIGLWATFSCFICFRMNVVGMSIANKSVRIHYGLLFKFKLVSSFCPNLGGDGWWSDCSYHKLHFSAVAFAGNNTQTYAYNFASFPNGYRHCGRLLLGGSVTTFCSVCGHMRVYVINILHNPLELKQQNPFFSRHLNVLME